MSQDLTTLMNTTSNGTCRLLTLPLELRRQIYGYTLVASLSKPTSKGIKSSRVLSLTVTCRQLYKEVFTEYAKLLTPEIERAKDRLVQVEGLYEQAPWKEAKMIIFNGLRDEFADTEFGQFLQKLSEIFKSWMDSELEAARIPQFCKDCHCLMRLRADLVKRQALISRLLSHSRWCAERMVIVPDS